MTRTLACFYLLFSIGANAETITPRVPAQCSEPNSTEAFVLNNGVSVVLVSAPERQQAHVALAVATGSKDDLPEIPGLAHFVEHMIFMGSTAFPEANGFKGYLGQRGGDTNAETGYATTTYHYNVDGTSLSDSLTYFVDMFVSPLFLPASVDRERLAVHAEYDYRRHMLHWQIKDVVNEILGPDHPLARFSIGNRNTLGSWPPEALSEKVTQFWKSQYSAERMGLVISAPYSLADLRVMAKEKFSKITRKPLSPIMFPPSPGPHWQAGLAKVVLDDDTRYLLLRFPLPPQSGLTEAAAEGFIAHLLGQEQGEGLSAQLRKEELAQSVYAEVNQEDKNSPSIELHIDLYYKGGQQYWDVIRRVFAYVDQLRKQPLDKWRFDEFQALKTLQWCYSPESDSAEAAKQLVREGPRYSLAQDAVAETFSPEIYDNLLAAISPDHMLAIVVDPDFHTNQQSRWFGSEFSYEPLDADEIENYKPKGSYDLKLPEKNPFVPVTFERKIRINQPVPVQVESRPRFNGWYGTDPEFDSPKSYLNILLRSPEIGQDERGSALATIFVSLLSDKMGQSLAAAEEVDTRVEIEKIADGFELKFSGYTDSISLLLEQMMAHFQYYQDKESQVEGYQYAWSDYLSDFNQRSPDFIGNSIFYTVLTPSEFTSEALTGGMSEVSYPRIISLLEDMRAQLSIASLAYGNVSQKQAVAWNQLIAKALIHDDEDNNPDETPLSHVRLPIGINRRVEESTFPESLGILYVQGADSTLEEKAHFAVLSKMINASFFQTLRTKKQLGYMIGAEALSMQGVPGIQFQIQSPVASPEKLEQEILGFIAYFPEIIRTMPAEQFDAYLSAAKHDVRVKSKDLDSQIELFWNEIKQQTYAFQNQQALIQAIGNIESKPFRQWYHQRAVGDDRRLLSILVEGRHHSIGSDWLDEVEPTVIEDIEDFHASHTQNETESAP